MVSVLASLFQFAAQQAAIEARLDAKKFASNEISAKAEEASIERQTRVV
jgi:hypothetical protein